jgi:hypothetical protein
VFTANGALPVAAEATTADSSGSEVIPPSSSMPANGWPRPVRVAMASTVAVMRVPQIHTTIAAQPNNAMFAVTPRAPKSGMRRSDGGATGRHSRNAST